MEPHILKRYPFNLWLCRKSVSDLKAEITCEQHIWRRRGFLRTWTVRDSLYGAVPHFFRIIQRPGRRNNILFKQEILSPAVEQDMRYFLQRYLVSASKEVSNVFVPLLENEAQKSERLAFERWHNIIVVLTPLGFSLRLHVTRHLSEVSFGVKIKRHISYQLNCFLD